MPALKNSTGLRNRYRVTNKTRLKVIKGDIDAESILVDEDEERARVVSTAGVDAEDANEHHLQAVLSAASHRATTLAQKYSRDPLEETKATESATAFIPVPDAAGIVKDYETLYPSNKWTDPFTYIKSSDCIEDDITNALADGFSYFMDERDNEWLERNNQEARGEGTSTQASLSSSGTTTRSGGSHRSAKSRGKEPDLHPPFEMDADDFELVMGVFDKITHDNTPFLHLSVQQGGGTGAIPAFPTYQDVFSAPLSGTMFATLLTPPKLPPPTKLAQMARAVYPHWRDRRAEREGHRIIPTLNYDESDTKNESYICFRRREIKAVRKTRAAQVSSSDKLVRLKAELSSAQTLVNQALNREIRKREVLRYSAQVWQSRATLVDLKRKYPAYNAKEDEDLLFDKERPVKKMKSNESQTVNKVKVGLREAQPSPTPVEPIIRPRDHANRIQGIMEDYLKRLKERDHHWEDLVDNPYQPDVPPPSERYFKHVTPASLVEGGLRSGRPLRLRVGRGGRMHIDRRSYSSSYVRSPEDYQSLPSQNPQKYDGLDKTDLDEVARRISERWRHDTAIAITLDSGLDEEDRILVDDFQPRYLRYSMQLLQDSDHTNLATNPALYISDGQNGMHVVSPFKFGIPPMQPQQRRDLPLMQRQHPMGFPQMQQTPSHAQHNPNSFNGTPVSMQTPIRKMATPGANQPIRVPSNGNVRIPGNPSLTQGPPPNPGSNAAASNILPMVNGFTATSNASPPNGAQLTNHNTPSTPIPVHSSPPVESADVRPKSRDQTVPATSPVPVQAAATFTNNVVNAYSGLQNGLPNGYSNGQHQILNIQQAQSLKHAFVGMPGAQAIPMQAALPPNGSVPPRPQSAFQHLPPGPNGTNIAHFNMMGPVNMNLKLPAARQAGWTGNQRPPIIQHNGDTSPNMMPALPAGMNRTPSINGHHLSPRNVPSPTNSNQFIGQGQERVSPLHFTTQSLSPHLGSPMQPHSSPPSRPIQTTVPSPSQQHQMHQGAGF